MDQERVLFTSLFGSKLYGTDTPESDTDYKAVYMPSIRKLLRGNSINNSVSSTGAKDAKNDADDEDFEMIPVQVFMRDFLSGQSYAYELAYNALDEDLEVHLTFRHICKGLTARFSTSNVNAMTGYALNQAQKYGVKGTRLNSLMAFNTLVDKHATDPNAKLKDSLEFVEDVLELVQNDVHVKFEWYHGPMTRDSKYLKDPSFTVLNKVFGLEITFAETQARLVKMLAKYGHRSYQARAASGSDWKAISHALRVVDQAIDILQGNGLVFPRPLCAFYRDVKIGKYKWEYVSEVISERLEVLAEAQETTNLQSHTPELVEKFYEWNDDLLDELYFPSYMTEDELQEIIYS